ncbi:MAG: Holliday junction resolvase RecU [Bacilli bacterium]|nr:Holliday junction resolvase RecU [Bacilli bacterium]
MNYPAGVKPRASASSPKAKKKKTLKVAAGNRGMSFEAAINATNEYYKEKGICLVTKRPTPINIVKVDYSHGATITQAYFETQSTTDYNGICRGRYIDFEAKSTRNKTSFPLANIPVQQIDHLERVLSQGGIAFFLIDFELLHEVYLLPAAYVIVFYRERERASIPVEEIKKNGFLVKEGFMPRYDYFPVLEEAFLK